VRSRTRIGIEALGLCAGRPRVLCAGLKMISSTRPAGLSMSLQRSRKRNISTRILGKRIELRGQSCNELLRNRLKHVNYSHVSICALRTTFINPLLCQQPTLINTVWTYSSSNQTVRYDASSAGNKTSIPKHKRFFDAVWIERKKFLLGFGVRKEKPAQGQKVAIKRI
jgi:hypothetical protein